MSVYYNNLVYLLDRKDLSVAQFENVILIPKNKILEPTPVELVKIANYLDISIDLLITRPLKNLNKVLSTDIKMIILDVDGTMTDGGMYFTENGDQMKKYNTKDGMAIKNLVKTGFQFGIISHGYKIKVVEDRAKLLGIQNLYVGKEDKLTILNQWLTELNLTLEQVAFVGDDINDIKIMEAVGLSACPKDAVKSVKAIADIILEKDGGKACVREFIDEYITK
ncbi:3-deoxy-D-manno-octulosonate 8-phosphate phosphatase [Putridiphycobacter roseus]|uniref:3-deoxy-D-manno-octulosonate 8-phosphate phosphatase n=1 Tax=Putridiphycobacter roseus TaxID=2219161 RepID=A0A2W1NDV2_9FLAO|nr:HAD-IIIA family hydrolase [Putridiphycobacter roseus]PZE16246.1 3-deoxy-D-manno-octulosonate 8-phosphate phosphatase [Putridiphycobacter roseus]